MISLTSNRLNGSAHRIQGERPLRCYPCSITLATLSGNRTNYMVNLFPDIRLFVIGYCRLEQEIKFV